MIATTDPSSLPEGSTLYLETNAPIPGTAWAQESALKAQPASAVLRLYTLRYWIGQSYKQVKQHLGWAEYQVRGALAIKRHWQLVLCAFSFCWWAAAKDEAVEQGKPQVKKSLTTWPRALRQVRAYLEPYLQLLRFWQAFSNAPPPAGLSQLLERLWQGQGINLYAWLNKLLILPAPDVRGPFAAR